jgi:hypothetical protein
MEKTPYNSGKIHNRYIHVTHSIPKDPKLLYNVEPLERALIDYKPQLKNLVLAAVLKASAGCSI